MIDVTWPALWEAFERWLASAHVDGAGKRRVPLSELAASLADRDD